MKTLNKKLNALVNPAAKASIAAGRRNFLRQASATPLLMASGSAALPLLLTEEAEAQFAPSPYGDEERDFRWSRLRAFMSENGLDCMVIPKGKGEGNNSHQFAEYYSNARFMNPGAVIFPLEGDPAVVGAIPMPGAWISQTVHKWDEQGDQAPISGQIVDYVKEMGHENSNIGVVGTTSNVDGLNEFNNEGFVTYATWDGVIRGLPNATFIDVTGPLSDMLMVRSDDEIQRIIKASLLGERLHEMLLEITHSGMDSMDFRLAVADFLVRNRIGPDVQAVYLPPGPIPEGFVINSEYGILHDGGYAQVTLGIACGKVDPEIEKLAEVAQEVMDYGQENLRTGVRFGDVIEPMEKMIADAGYWHRVPVIHGLPMHAVGPVCDGGPPQGRCSMTRAADMIVQPNMSWTFEPAAHIGNGPGAKSVKVGGMAVTTRDGINMINTLGLRLQRVS